MENKKVKRLNTNKTFFPKYYQEQPINLLLQEVNSQEKYIMIFNSLLIACEQKQIEIEEVNQMVKDSLQQKTAFFIFQFDQFQILMNSFYSILKNSKIKQNSLIKILSYFQLKQFKNDEQLKKILHIIYQFFTLIDHSNPYFNRYLFLSLVKVFEPLLKSNQQIAQVFIENCNQQLQNNINLQTTEGLLLIYQLQRSAELIYQQNKLILLSVVQKSFIQFHKFMLIGNDKFIFKIYLIHKNEAYNNLLTGISEYSDSEQTKLLSKIEIIFQKIRNYSSICLALIIRQYPNLILNTKNFFLLIKPLILSQKFTHDMFISKDDILTNKLINYTLIQNETSLIHCLLTETYLKNRINIINILTSLIEAFNLKYVFQIERYEKDQKITNPNFLPLAHQVYNSFKHLFSGVFYLLQKEQDIFVINHMLRFLSIFINRQFLQIFPVKIIKAIYDEILIKFLKTSEVYFLFKFNLKEISIRSNSLNCLSQIININFKLDFIEQDILSGFNLIKFSLTNIQKQLNIESLQQLQIVKSCSITWLFENLLFIQKVQKIYGEYFFPYYDEFFSCFNQIKTKLIDSDNQQIQEYSFLRIKFCYKIIEEMTKILSYNYIEFQQSVLDYSLALFPKNLQDPNHEIINISISILGNILKFLKKDEVKSIISFFISQLNLQTSSNKQNYYKMLGNLSVNKFIQEDVSLRSLIILQLIEKLNNPAIENFQASSLNDWNIQIKLPDQEPIFEKAIYFCQNLTTENGWILLINVLTRCESSFIDQIINNTQQIKKLKELVNSRSTSSLKSFNKIILTNSRLSEQLLDTQFYKNVSRQLTEEIQIKLFIQIFKILKNNYKSIKFSNKQAICDLCFNLMNLDLSSLKYEDFKSIQKFQNHLIHLSLSLISIDVAFNMVYPFYYYFWTFVRLQLKPILIDCDFENMEKLVDDQMNIKYSQDNIDELKNTGNKSQAFYFDFNLLTDEGKNLYIVTKREILQNFEIIRKASAKIYQNQNLTQFNYQAFNQFESLDISQKFFLNS